MKILFFSAVWCGACKSWLPKVDTLAKQSGIDLILYDCETDKSEARKYNVKGLSTLIIVDENNKVLRRFSSVAADSELIDALNMPNGGAG